MGTQKQCSDVPRSRYLNLRGTFVNSGGHTKFIQFYLLIETDSSHNFRKFLFVFLLNFELNVNSFGSRFGVDDTAVVSAIVVVFNHPVSFLFLIF